MRYDVGRFRRPMRRSTEGQLMSLISLGDGSTLTLDFTTGVLDPRLTFTRLSDATFINNSGLVQWAAANRGPRTNWAFTNPAGLGWNAATTVGTGTFQWVGDGTVIASSGALGQAYTSISAATQIAQGIRYVMSVTAQSVTGSPTIQSIFDFTSASGNTYFKNGSTAFATTTVASGDRISVSAIADSTGMNIRMGCGAWFASRTNESVTLTQFHWHPGAAPVPYYENTTGSPRYDSARFDHDPTTLAPRGLLIEGAAVNLCLRSEDFGNASWQVDNSGATNPVVSTVSQTAPNGASSVNRVTLNKTGGTFSRLYQAITGTAGQTYTLSVWMKANTANGGAATQNVGLRIGGSTGINCVVTTTWQRFTHPAFAITGTDANFQLLLWDNVPANDETADVLVWGAQVELGSGASSYIPTGASQGSRAADSCVMTGTNFSSWFAGATEGVLFVEFEKPRSQSGTIGNDHAAVGSRYASGSAFIVYSAASVYYPTTLLWPTGGAIFPGGIASAIPSVSKQAGKWFGGNDATNFANGVQGTTTAGTGTLTPTMLSVGANSQTGTEATRDWLNSCVRRVKFWPVALPDSQIISLTT